MLLLLLLLPAEHLHTEQYPAFVLFIDLNPHDVDVNVHPTKHEVRFHQARLIHDFICQGVTNALNAIPQAELDLAPTMNEAREPSASYQTHYEPKPNRAAAGQNIFASHYHQPREKQSENRPHFSNRSSTFRRMVIVNNLQRPNNAYMMN